MALPSSGVMHFGGLADNNESASKDSISMQAYSRIFASGSEVGNVDGSGAADTIADRNQLNSTPHAMSEFYDAHIPNAQFGSVVAKLVDETAVTSNGYVDGEAGRIYWTITEDPAGSTTYTGGLKYKSDGSVAASSTLGFDGTGTKYVTITAPSTTEQVGSPYRYYSFVSTDIFKNAVGADLSHYDQLSGGSVNSTTTSFTIDASSETNQFLIRPVVSVGTQGSYSTSTSQVTAGDNRGISIGSSGGSPASSSVTMTGAGVTQITATHIGSPTQARNYATSTENITVAYNQAIESLTLVTSATVNYGSSNVTISVISEGVNGVNCYVGYDDNNTAADTTFTWSYDTVTSLYVRTSVSKTFTAPAGSYYIKAKHHGDDETVVGASLIVAPTFVYTTIGDSADISVNGTSHTFRVTSSTGNNIGITISNNLNATTTTDYGTGFSLSPGTADGIYTVTYTGTANYSQTNNQTDTVNCYPDANYTINSGDTTLLINSPAGAGLTDDNLQLNATTSVGDNISAYYYVVTKDTAFLDASLNKTYTDAITTIAASTLESDWGPGTYNTSLRVTGGGSLQNTQTDNDSFTIADHPPQALTVTAPNGNILRRGSAFSILWSKTSAVYVNLKLYRDVLLNGSYTFDSNIDVAGDNTGTSYSWTVPGDATLVNDRYKVYGYVYNGTATDFSPIFSIRDGLSGIPTTVSATAGNGEATLSWVDGVYNAGGNYVYIYDSGGNYISTSTQAGTSYTYPYSSDNQYTVKFKVSGKNLTSEEGDKSGFSNAVIVYPVLGSGKNVIDPDRSTIYSETNNNNTGTYVLYVTYDTPDTPTDNVTSRTYSTSALTGHTFGNGSSTSHAATTTTYGSGTGVGSRTITLSIAGSGNPSQNSSTTHGVTINYMPRIYDITFTSGTILINTTDLYIKSITWQGFDSGGFTVQVRSASGGGGSEIGEHEPAINDIGGIAFNANCLNNDEGGTQKTGTVWSHNNAANIGTVSTAGTVYLRVTDITGTYSYEESLTIASYTFVALGGYIVESVSAGFDTQEAAAVGTPPAGDPYSAAGYYLGTLGSGTVQILSSQGGSGFAGGNKWWDMSGGYIGYIDNSGNLLAANYIADANAQPLAPTSMTFTSVTTSQIVVGWSDAPSAIEDGFKLYYATDASADSGDSLIYEDTSTSHPHTSLSTRTPVVNAFTATASTTVSGRIVLGWSLSTTDSFTVYQSTNSDMSGASSIATSGVSLTVNGLSDSTTYYFRITAATSTGVTYYYGVYAYNGSALSSVLQGNRATSGTSINSSTVNATTLTPSVPTINAAPSSDSDSTMLDGYTLVSTNFDIDSENREGNNIQIYFNQTSPTGGNNFQYAYGTSTNPTNWRNCSLDIGVSSAQNIGANDQLYVKLRRGMYTGDGMETITGVVVNNNGESTVTDTFDVTFTFQEGK